MREHYQYRPSPTTALAIEARKKGMFFWEYPIDRYLPNGRVICKGKEMLMLAGYSYLGFIDDKNIADEAQSGIQEYGLGAHGSRTMCGTTMAHKKLEAEISQTNKSEDTILYPSGFQANLGTIATTVGPGDAIFSDELNHASIVDGCRLSGADTKIFKHNDLVGLRKKLLDADKYRNRLIVVDAIYSMDGDIAPIPDLIQLCDEFGAILLVDEAHSLGVLGECGFGVVEYFKLRAGDIDLITGVLSKAIPGNGGYVSGSNDVIDFFRNNSRPYIFTGSIAPFHISVALASLNRMKLDIAPISRLWKNTQFFQKKLKAGGVNLAGTESPITPIVLGETSRAMLASKHCMDNGVYLQAIPYPIVPKGQSRLRATVTASHTIEGLDRAADVILEAANKF